MSRSSSAKLEPGKPGSPEGMNAQAVAAQGKPPVVTSEGTIRSGRLKGLTMWQAIWVLSWPILIESFLNALVGLVDTTLAASLSEAATDAVGAASYFLWFISLVGMALGVGVTALVSRSMGKGRVAAASAAVGQSTLMSLGAGLLVALLISFAAPGIASLLQLQEEAREGAISYLRILAFGVPAQTFLLCGIAACRGAGDAFRPLMIMAVINFVNVVLSFLLSGANFGMTRTNAGGEVVTDVLVPGFDAFQMGINGIAWGTVIAWNLGAVLMALLLIRGTHGVRLMLKRIRPHKITMGRLIRISIPSGIETFGMWFGNFLIIMIVGSFAMQGLLGSHIVAIRIEAFSFLPGFAMSMAASTLAGQYLGAGSPRLAKMAIFRCTAISASIMFCFGVLFITLGKQITGLFSQQPTHLELVPKLLFICGITQIPFAISICIRGSLRGAGDTRMVMMLTWVSTYAIRLPLAYFCSGVDLTILGQTYENPLPILELLFGIEPGLVGLWIALCGEHVTRALLFMGRFFQGGWVHVKV
ncbi:MAG: MATE family efflux transporter [Phycisphaerales bacterium JB065]